MSFELIDHSKECEAEVKQKILKALEMCGLVAEGYAIDKVPVDTGRLKNSISHKVVPSEEAVYIGTNVEYAPFVEFGTGKYYDGGGRKTPWAYKSKGTVKRTGGQKAQPYLRPAVADHKSEYIKIYAQNLIF